jgi:F-type H+-transporting ATPase subunit b
MIRGALLCLWIVSLAAPALASEGGGSGLLFPILNFVLLVAVIVYFAGKPIREFFNARRATIQDDLHDLHATAEFRREAEARYAKWQRKLVDLEAELEQIRATSRERAEAERERIVSDANATAERIRSEATAAIEQELRRSREVLTEDAANLAVELAGDLLREHVTDGDRDRLVTEFIERIERTADAGASGGAGTGR